MSACGYAAIAHPIPVDMRAIKALKKSPLALDIYAWMTVNIRDDVHQALKIRAVQERTTVGDLIEAWVDGWKP